MAEKERKAQGRGVLPGRLREGLLPVMILVGLTVALTLGWDWFVSPDDRILGIFFKPENLANILRQNAHYGILAVGLTGSAAYQFLFSLPARREA